MLGIGQLCVMKYWHVVQSANKLCLSSGCTLILTEGDSAKTLAVAGLGVIGRDYYGVYPLKGNIL